MSSSMLKRLGLATALCRTHRSRCKKNVRIDFSILKSIGNFDSLDADRELLENIEASRLFTDFWAFILVWDNFRPMNTRRLRQIYLVDEASMIDLSLMHRLLRAMDSQLIPTLRSRNWYWRLTPTSTRECRGTFINLAIEANRIHEVSHQKDWTDFQN